MEGLMICIFIIIVLACAIAVFYATIYNKFQEYIIRINEVESMIDTYLRNKYDLINKSIPIIKGNIKSEKEIFGEKINYLLCISGKKHISKVTYLNRTNF